MGLRCGLIGLPLCGKTTIFNAITAAKVSIYGGGAEVNRAVVNMPDERIEILTEMYHPQKTIYATLEIVDIPGIKPQDSVRGTRLLGNIKTVEALVHVIRCFDDEALPYEYKTVDPKRDTETIDLELMASDVTTLENKLTRLEKKIKSGDKDTIREAGCCEKVRNAIQDGVPARKQALSAQELSAVKECNLISQKPVLYVANIKTMADVNNKHVQALKQIAETESTEMVIICGKDEADIAELEPQDRVIFLKELGLQESSMERLLHAAYRNLGLISFFTVGPDEVRAWTCRQGDKAPAAAGKIHTDLEAGFIRMEVMAYNDLMAAGNEVALARVGKKRVEGRDYEVHDGDIVQVLFNVKGQ